VLNAWTVVKRNPVICVLALLAAVALIVVSEGSYWRSLAAIERLAQGQQERVLVRELQIGMLEAESAQRGYLLTGRQDHLQPHAAAVKEVGDTLDRLERTHADTSSMQPALAALRQAVQLKLAEMAQAIRQRDEGPMSAAAANLASDAGIAQMKAIFLRTDELLALEAQQGVARAASLQRVLELSRVGVISLCVIGLLALFLYLRHGLALQAHELDLKRTAQVERERLEAEVIQRTAQLTDLTRHLLSAREDERNRLARDLHDELGSLLTSAKLDAARIKSRLAGAAPEAQERLAHLVQTLNASIALGRSIIEDLRPSTLANLGLVSAIEILVREFAERSGVQVHRTLAPVKLKASAELMVYRLVQEAITNISKYAKAKQVWVTLAAQDGQVQVSVRDDGVGFDTNAQPGSTYGLVGMRFRVEAERGVLTVESDAGQGTRVAAILPESA